MSRSPIVTAAPTVVGNYSTVISLLTLSPDGPVCVGLSKAATSGDKFELYGTTDSTVTSSTGCVLLGTLSGGNLNPGGGSTNPVMPWYLYYLLKRTAGSTACNLICDANQAADTRIVTAAPNVVGNYSTVIDATSLNAAAPIRAGLSKAATSGDKFELYGTTDSTVTTSTGCVLLGTLSGGNLNPGGGSTVTVQSYPYYLLKRTAGSTACNLILGSSTAPPPASGDVLPTPSTLVLRTPDGGGEFTHVDLAASGVAVATTGRVRTGLANQAIVVSLDDAGTSDVSHVAKGANSATVLGDAAGQINFNPGPVRWVATASTPGIDQANPAPGTSGEPMTITAQRGDGAGQRGGDLVLRAGGGVNTATAGNVALVTAPASAYGAAGAVFVGGVSASPSSNPTNGLLLTAHGAGAALRVYTTGGVAASIGDGGLGFFAKGAAPQAQVAAYTLNYAAAASRTLDDYTNTPSGIDNAQVGAVYATAADLLLASNQIKNLSAVLKQWLTDGKGYGLTA